MTDLTLQSLAERLVRVERQNRRLKAVAILAAAVLAAAVCAGQVHVPEKVTAGQFVVRDNLGKVQGSFGASTEGTILSLYGPKPGANPRAVLYVSETGPVLALSDPDGSVRARLSAWTGPAAAGGVALMLGGEDGTARAHLYLGVEGPVLDLCDREGKPRTTLRLGKDDQPRFEVIDAEGKARQAMTIPEDRLLMPEHKALLNRLQTEFQPELRRINNVLADFDDWRIDVEDWIAAHARPEPPPKPEPEG